jgi:cytochrome c
MLAKKIQAGGTGVWGEDIMPPQPQVSDAEALELANYILSLKK